MSELSPDPDFDLDEITAERLLAGAVAPDEAPPGYGPVVETLASATAPPHDSEVAGESAALAAFREARTAVPTRPNRRPHLAVGLATAAGAVLLCTSVAAAAGLMPGAMQSAVHDALGKVGITVPDGDHGPVEAPDPTTTTITVVAPAAEGDTGTTTGTNPGADTCTAASDGNCKAGDPPGADTCTAASDGNCKASDPPGQNPDSPPPSNPAASGNKPDTPSVTHPSPTTTTPATGTDSPGQSGTHPTGPPAGQGKEADG